MSTATAATGRLSDRERAEAVASLSGSGWSYQADRRAIRKEYCFRSFPLALAFITGVLGEAHRRDHHPELSNVYTRVILLWTTHDCDGLSGKDIDMALFCDELGQKLLG